MWILTRTQIPFLKKIVFGLSAIFVALSYKQIILFASLILGSLVKETVPTQLTADLMLKSGQPFGLLGLPLLLTSATLLMLYKYEGALATLGKFLSMVTISLFAALSYYLVRDILHPAPDFFAHPAGFIERGVITTLIAGAGLGVALGGFHKNLDLLKAFGSVLVTTALARIVYFDLLLFNPYYNSSQSVGMLPLINGLTLTYGGGTLLAILGARSVLLNRGQAWLETGYRVTALALLFTFVTLTVRHAFHDTVYQSGAISNAELYTYSIVWLLTGLGLLAYGLVRDLKSIRLASLGFMLLTIGKVFLIDAGELEGLYRIASFLGLGVSLIGLSYFYTRFILKK